MHFGRTFPTHGYGQVSQGYGSVPFPSQLDQAVVPQPTVQPLTSAGNLVDYLLEAKLFPLSSADILCQGQTSETVIPLEGGRKFVVCLDESKGVEQECPKGLVYHTESKRCERSMFGFPFVYT